MSKISVISPVEPGERSRYWSELLDKLRKNKAIREDTEFGTKLIEKHTLTLWPYVETYYFDLLQRPYTVEAIIQAEKEGYDAAIDVCYFDPGLDEAREVVDIPVVGTAEASFSYALMLGRKKGSIAVIAVAEKGILKTFDVLDKYGFTSHLIPVRPVRSIPNETYNKAVTTGKESDIQAAKDAFVKVARGCIADGAEVVIVGCGGLGPLLETQGVMEVDGVPVLDCVPCAIMMAEDLIGLKKLGTSVSRRFMYRKPLEEDWKKERKNFGFSEKS